MSLVRLRTTEITVGTSCQIRYGGYGALTTKKEPSLKNRPVSQNETGPQEPQFKPTHDLAGSCAKTPSIHGFWTYLYRLGKGRIWSIRCKI